MCDICCEPIKKPIRCTICDFTACYKCFSKFLIECVVNPKCMKCDKPWSRKHLVNSFGQHFVTHKYKQKRENVLFELEQAMMPDTQPMAIRERKIDQLNRRQFELENERHFIDQAISRLEVGILDSEFEEYLENRKKLRVQRHELSEEITNVQYRKNRLLERPMRHEKKISGSGGLVIKCPGENCKGYNNGTCGLCGLQICKECHEPLALDKDKSLDAHVCKQENIDTVKLLHRDSKNCPSCKTLIYKIDGCDQMFCTQCHTAFSWRTGEICNGRIHNPHYYEYLRTRGTDVREMGDIPCGGLPYATTYILNNQFLRIVHRVVSHFENYEIPRINGEINNVNGNIDLRIAYLNERLTETMFKREIYKREKALEKKREILTVMNTFVVVCADIFRTLVIPNQQEHRTEFNSIRDFTNESMEDVSRVYKCAVLKINIDWSLR